MSESKDKSNLSRFDNWSTTAYSLPAMRCRKHMPNGFLYGLLVLSVIVVGVLPIACNNETPLAKASLCFTPTEASVEVDQSLDLVVTISTSEAGDRVLREESGWRWVWSSDDGGEIEFTQTEMQWSDGQAGGNCVASVTCLAKKAGTVKVEVEQPGYRLPFEFVENEACKQSCWIRIQTAPGCG